MALLMHLTNGFTQEYEDGAIETEEYYNGANRRTLTFHMDPAKVNLEDIRQNCVEANMKYIVLENDELEVTETYEDYVLRLDLQEVLIPKSVDSTEFVLTVILKVGKRTPYEQQLKDLEDRQLEIEEKLKNLGL